MKGFGPVSESREILTDSQAPVATSTPYGAATPADGPPVPVRLESWKFWPIPRRHYVALMAFLGFFNIYALRVNLSIAILEMTRNGTKVVNGTTVPDRGEFYMWSSVTKGIILGSFFYGYIITQLPGGWLAARVGGRVLFGLGVLGTALLTLLTPPLVHFGKAMIIVLRIAEGLCEGMTYPAIMALWRHWAPPLEKTKLATFAFAGSYFGTVVSMPLSAALGIHFGWPSIFYFFGLLALFWCSLWFKTIRETPSEDPRITKDELTYIQRCVGFSLEQVKELKPPWKSILRSKAVWAIAVAHFAENWGFYTMLTYLPKFMEDVLHFKLQKTGYTMAMPYLMMGVVVMGGGQLADYLRDQRHLSTGYVRRIFCCPAFLAQAFFIFLAAHSVTADMAVVCITLGVGLGGFAWAGFSVNHLDIAPQYASVLMGLTNTVATLGGIISPAIVGFVVTSGEVWQWRLIFYISATVYTVGAGLYFLLASGEVQSWAEIPGGYVSQLSELGDRLESEPQNQSETGGKVID